MKKFNIVSKIIKKRKMVIKIEFTPLSDCKMLPFFKNGQIKAKK